MRSIFQSLQSAKKLTISGPNHPSCKSFSRLPALETLVIKNGNLSGGSASAFSSVKTLKTIFINSSFGHALDKSWENNETLQELILEKCGSSLKNQDLKYVPVLKGLKTLR